MVFWSLGWQSNTCLPGIISYIPYLLPVPKELIPVILVKLPTPAHIPDKSPYAVFVCAFSQVKFTVTTYSLASINDFWTSEHRPGQFGPAPIIWNRVLILKRDIRPSDAQQLFEQCLPVSLAIITDETRRKCERNHRYSSDSFWGPGIVKAMIKSYAPFSFPWEGDYGDPSHKLYCPNASNWSSKGCITPSVHPFSRHSCS